MRGERERKSERREREIKRERDREARERKKNREGEKEVGRERMITVGCLWYDRKLRVVKMYSCHVVEK